jgi:recombination protein RecA
VRIDIRRIGSIKKGEEVIGNETRVKVVKNKVAPPFKTADFDILYNEGISREGEIIELGVLHRIVEKSGAWYAYKRREDRPGQGQRARVPQGQPGNAAEIESKIREAIGIVGGMPQAATRTTGADCFFRSPSAWVWEAFMASKTRAAP